MLKEKKKSEYESEKNLLKKYGLNYKPNMLLSTAVVLIISMVACGVDGTTVYLTFDSILKGNTIFNMLMTVMAAAILDVFPMYFPLAIMKIRKHQEEKDRFYEHTIKLSLIGGVATWILLFISLCLVRSFNADFIVAQQLKRQALYNVTNDGTFHAVLSSTGKHMIMLFMDVLNVGTSVGVFLASMLSTPSEKENLERKRVSYTIDWSEIVATKQNEACQLESVINNTEQNKAHGKEEISTRREEAKSKAITAKVEAREVLESTVGDSDVSVVVTESSETIVNS